MTKPARLRRSWSRNRRHTGKLHETAIALIEREMIRACLESTRGRLASAAKMLGISRTTLRKKVALHGIRTTTSIELGS